MSPDALDVFISYSHDDQALLEELVKHLALLKREELIRTWSDREITAGEDWRGKLDARLEKADLILMLVSSSFISSDYCWDVEAMKALERHARGDARVVPILVRDCDWETAPFASFQALPTNRTPVTRWNDRDSAWREVARGLRKAIAVFREGAPRYPDEESRDLSGKLERLHRRKKDLLKAEESTQAIDTEIVKVRRKLRRGPQLQPGEFLADGRYELLGVIGHGGFATVWKAWDDDLERLVALKVLHGQYAEDRRRRERFFRGARKMAELEHPHIVRVLERELTEGGWYLSRQIQVTDSKSIVLWKVSRALRIWSPIRSRRPRLTWMASLRRISGSSLAESWKRGVGALTREVTGVGVLTRAMSHERLLCRLFLRKAPWAESELLFC